MTKEKYPPSQALKDAVEGLKAFSDSERAEFMERLKAISPVPKYPGYIPDSASDEGIRGLYEYLIYEGTNLIEQGDYSASGIIWSMLEELSLVIGDANGMSAKIVDLNEMVRTRDELILDVSRESEVEE